MGGSQKRINALFFVLGASLTLLTVSLGVSILIRNYGTRSLSALVGGNARAHATPLSQAGPWGILEPIEVPLANPDGAVPDQEQRFQDFKWFFENETEAKLTDFLRSCGLRDYQRKALMNRDAWETHTNGITIYPAPQIVWSLEPKPRQQIYSRLALSSSNYPQCFPFRFPPESFAARLRMAGLPSRQIDQVRRLTYTNGNYLCLADLEALRQVLPPGDFKDLLQTLYVTPTYFLRVRIPANGDVDSLIKYWGKGGREKRIAPILNSVARIPGGGAINVSYLMPTFARLRLYTYPDSWNDPTVAKQDCFFTTMNFFNESPNTNFLNAEYSKNVIEKDFEPVDSQPLFGDVVLVLDAKGEVIHTCAYIADDFVFTKNGINPTQPWVIMRLADMLLIYCAPDQQARIVFLRGKNIG
jgi:hypothetical protein